MKAETRAYTSPLRVEQQEATRQRLLEAVLAELREHELDEISFTAVARRANVAERTVFRHFATKEALLDAFWRWWIEERFQVPIDDAVSPDDLPRLMHRLYEAYERNEAVM